MKEELHPMTYNNTTIRGTFKEYRLTNFTYNDGTHGQQIKVILTNCQDLTTDVIYPEVSFNLTKSFQQFGVINDHPVIDVACRHYDGQNSQDENFGFQFPSNVNFANNYQKFTSDLNKNIQLIQHLQEA